MSELVIEDLAAAVDGTQILRGVDLRINSGEVHAVMGPNGSGKSTLSHVLAGRPGYDVTGGRVLLDGADVLAMAPHERARAGLFLGMQYPVEVPGVSVEDLLTAALAGSDRAGDDVRAAMVIEAERIGFDAKFLERSLNVDLSGGERKRNETLQLGVLRPRFAVLDELDSGLDVDALRAVSRRVAAAVAEDGVGVLAITHYDKLLQELTPDVVHVFVGGRILRSGGPELAAELEGSGYADYRSAEVSTGSVPAGDPFADPLA